MLKWLITLILGKPDVCVRCQVLAEQLEYEKQVNTELIATLTAQLKPQVIVSSSESAEPKPIHSRFRSFGQRRAELEKEARIRAEKLRSPLAGKPDSERVVENAIKPEEPNHILSGQVSQLEMELGIPSEEKVN